VTDKESSMRRVFLLPMVLLAACSDDKMTRDFSLSRDTAPESVAATRMPLSMPPGLATRPVRPGALVPTHPDAPASEQAAGSAGQDALLQAAGPAASSDIRAEINENSGLVYPDPGFVDRLMNWTPPSGYTPVIVPAPKGGWFSRIF
jgi:Protein of unknown function (DUF3035)